MSDKKSMVEIEKKRLEMINNWDCDGERNFINKLEEMMDLQKRFASKFCKFDKLTTKQREKWTKEYVLCCMDELSEILNWTNWKHWRKYNKNNINQLEVKYEIIDLLHFVMDLMHTWKMTPDEVFSMYIVKNRENHDRQKRRY